MTAFILAFGLAFFIVMSLDLLHYVKRIALALESREEKKP